MSALTASAEPRRGLRFFRLYADGSKPNLVCMPAGGSRFPASETPVARNCIVVPVRTLDGLAAERSLQGPFALKLDTHGFEVPILEGARELLKQSELLIVECYNFRLTEHSLLAHEMCAYLGERGFRCIDLCDPLYRERDGALWQMDLFFVPGSNPAFESNAY